MESVLSALELVSKYSSGVAALTAAIVAVVIWLKFGRAQAEYLEGHAKHLQEELDESKRLRTADLQAFQADREGFYEAVREDWKWSWLHEPRSIYEQGPPYNDPKYEQAFLVLEKLHEQHVRLDRDHICGLAKFYFFNKRRSNLARAKELVCEYRARYADDQSIEIRFLEAVVHDLSALPRNVDDEPDCTAPGNPADLSRALEAYRAVVHVASREHPYRRAALNNLAELLACKFHRDPQALNEAAAAATEAVSLRPGYFASLDSLAKVREAQGHYDDAITSYLDALEAWRRDGGADSKSGALIQKRMMVLIRRQARAWEESRLGDRLVILDRVLETVARTDTGEVKILREKLAVACGRT